jgi:hypothetical protein
MHKMLMPKAAQSYKPIELLEAQQLSIDLLDEPERFLMHHRRFTCSTMFNITYGRRLPSWDCKEVEDVFKDLDGFTSIQNPGQWLIDAFPELEYLPEKLVQNWKTEGQKIHAHEKQLWMGLWNQLKVDVADGTAPPCFAKDFLNSEWREQGIDELQAAYINGTMIEVSSNCGYLTIGGNRYYSNHIEQSNAPTRVTSRSSPKSARRVRPRYWSLTHTDLGRRT